MKLFLNRCQPALTLDSFSQACFCFGHWVICFKLATHLGSETDFVCESSWVRSIQLKCVLNFHVWNPFALPHTYHFQSVVNSIQRLATGIFRNIVKLVHDVARNSCINLPLYTVGGAAIVALQSFASSIY